MENANNVDQIRDLIFGSQIKEFEVRFKQLNSTLQQLEDRLTKAFEESHQKLYRDTQRQLEVLDKKIENLSATTQRDKNKLRELIDSTDETLQERIRAQKDEFDTRLRVAKESVDDDIVNLTQNMKETRQSIESLLEAGLAKLTDEKLSRDMMSQMLLDVAMKIKGTDIESVLTEDTESEK